MMILIKIPIIFHTPLHLNFQWQQQP